MTEEQVGLIAGKERAMGMFKKFKQMTGSVDKDLLKNGLPAGA